MIYGRSDNRQPQGHTHAFLKPVNLDWDMPLIMEHRDYRVVLAPHCSHEHGVCRERSVRVDPQGTGIRDCRREFLDFLPTKQATFATMGIYSSDRKSR